MIVKWETLKRKVEEKAWYPNFIENAAPYALLMSLEQGRSMSMLAAMMVDEPDAAERERNIAMAKVGVGQAGKFVSQNAVQLHGGIGMTEEYVIGHYFRRAMMFDHSFGDTAYYLGKLAAQVQ